MIKNIIFQFLFAILVPCLSFASISSYQYDNLHRLTRIERSDGAIITFTYDNLGNRTSKTATSTTAGGDLNGDGTIDLSDVILSLQIVSGMEPAAAITPAADVNNDGKIGIEETIYMLRAVGGL